MTARFNHTIIASIDAAEMARFYRALLEADDAPLWGPFTNLQLADGVLLPGTDHPRLRVTPDRGAGRPGGNVRT